jgi:histidinol phosphatase-like PHP family hydrolase
MVWDELISLPPKNICMIKILSTLALGLLMFSSCNEEKSFKLTDLHIHLKGDLTIDEAILKSEKEGIQYGIAANCGLGFPIENDSQIDSFLNIMKNYPQFYVGMQAEGREWMDLFSDEARNKFDYVFTDAMTFTDEKGRRNRIWIKEETWIDDEEAFMDFLVKTTVNIISNEPIDIYVNPTFLPEQMASRYDQFWTSERMDQVIEAAKKQNVAIEINNRFVLPSEAFIEKAHKAGLKFTIGTNNVDKSFTGADYAQKMIEKFDLKKSDFFLPEKKKR